MWNSTFHTVFNRQIEKVMLNTSELLQLMTELMNFSDETGSLCSVEGTHCLSVLGILFEDQKNNMYLIIDFQIMIERRKKIIKVCLKKISG